jgi:hypothetical protein
VLRLVLIVALAHAHAEDRESWLDIEECPRLDAQALRDHTLVELGGRDPEATATVTCEPDAFVVEISRPGAQVSTRRLARTSAVGEVPERYLALELAELLAGSRYPPQEREPEPEPEREPESEPEREHRSSPPSPSPEPAETPRRLSWFAASARAELSGEPVIMSGGGGLTLGSRVWRDLSLRLDIAALRGGRTIDTDFVRLDTIKGGLAALYTADAGRARLHAGVGARIVGVWMRGIERQSERVGLQHHGLTWAPFASLGLLAALGDRLVFTTSLDVGYTARPIRGLYEQSVVFAYRGVWGELSLGLGIRFGR